MHMVPSYRIRAFLDGPTYTSAAAAIAAAQRSLREWSFPCPAGPITAIRYDLETCAIRCTGGDLELTATPQGVLVVPPTWRIMDRMGSEAPTEIRLYFERSCNEYTWAVGELTTSLLGGRITCIQHSDHLLWVYVDGRAVMFQVLITDEGRRILHWTESD